MASLLQHRGSSLGVVAPHQRRFYDPTTFASQFRFCPKPRSAQPRSTNRQHLLHLRHFIPHPTNTLPSSPSHHTPHTQTAPLMFRGTSNKSKPQTSDGVKTEFVFADGAKDDVQLSGDWNDWKAIQMFHEGAGTWSVVTPVPPGPHEFKFIVDGEWKHSERHPTIGIDETSLNNVRYVLPEPDLGAADGTGSTKSSSRPARRDSRASSASIDSSSSRKKKGGGIFSRK